MATHDGVNGYPVPTQKSDARKGREYGARLLPQVLDELAETDPMRTYAIYPQSSDPSKGFRLVKMIELATAVHKLAFWIERTIGRSTTFETIAYIGSSDIRYTIVLVAAIKCGYKVNEAYRLAQQILYPIVES